MRILCLLFWLCCDFPAKAQAEEKLKDVIESISENTSEEIDFSELTDRLVHFRKHPINLHKTSPEELKNLYLLSPLQINNLLNYTKTNRLLDLLELQAVPGFDIHTVNRITPFVTLIQLENYRQLQPKHLVKAADHSLILRFSSLLEQQKGFEDLSGSRYSGSPEKLLLRYKYNFQQIISAALVMEKDAGEKLYNAKTGLDHLSAHLAFFKLGRITKLVIGDYSLQFGQGLTLWSGFAFGKGPDITSVAAKDVGLKPYTSANEASFLRGGANTINVGNNVYLSSFFSIRNLDASLTKTENGNFTLSNINISGLHRTQTELKNQKSLLQQVYGGVLQYLDGNLHIGVIGYYSEYEHAFVTGAQKYNYYAFTGKSLLNAGIHYNYTFKNVYLYGEFAHSIGSGKAFVNGAMASLSPKTSVVLLYRHYEKNYHNFFNNAIGEGTETNNEKGMYLGLNYRWNKRLTFSFYGDYFVFPWLRYRVDEASYGYETYGEISYTKGKNFKATLRFKYEHKQQNPETGSNDLGLHNVVKHHYRMEWNWKPNVNLKFHQRLEVSNYQKHINRKETGYLIYQDVDYAPFSSRFSANIRVAFFNTPSYNSRIYAYEDNVLYASGSGIYAGKGFRTFLNISYELLRKLDLFGRYALSVYPGAQTTGSGLDEIAGNKKSELKLQVRYQF